MIFLMHSEPISMAPVYMGNLLFQLLILLLNPLLQLEMFQVNVIIKCIILTMVKTFLTI